MVIDMNEKQYLEIAKKVNLSNFDEITKFKIGSAIKVEGVINASPKEGQP